MDSCGRVKTIRNTAQSIEDRLNVFLSAKQNISWIEKSDSGGLEFCSLPRELERILYHDLWHTGVHSIITSGTISVGGNFDHFKRMTGIDLLQPQNRRVIEVSKLSHSTIHRMQFFIYQRSCLSRIFMMRNILRPYPERLFI